jgi:hypothetical protein
MMTVYRRALVLLAVLTAIAALLPGVARAQDGPDDDDDVLIRINGTARVGADEAVDTVVTISGDAVIDGTVRDALVVIDGTATVNGVVEGDINVVSGRLELGPSARVDDVVLVRSDLIRDPAATVLGEIDDREGYSLGWGSFVFSLLFWLGMTILVLVAGLLAAAVAGRQVATAAALIRRAPLQSLLATLLVWIGLPILATLAIATLIGIPIGISLLIFLLPTLWFFGYLVTGTGLGIALTARGRRAEEIEHPYLAAFVGLLIFQLIGLIPVIGGLVIIVAGLIGAGLIAFRAWLAWRARLAAPVEPMPAT